MKLKVAICKNCVDFKQESIGLKRERDFYWKKCENYERQLAEYNNRNAERDKLLAETEKVASQLKDVLSKFTKINKENENEPRNSCSQCEHDTPNCMSSNTSDNSFITVDVRMQTEMEPDVVSEECVGNKDQECDKILNLDSLIDQEPDETDHPALHCPVSPEMRLSEESVPVQNMACGTEYSKTAKKSFYQICRWNVGISTSSSKLCAKVCEVPNLVGHIVDAHLSAPGTKDICLWENCEVYGQQFKPGADIICHIHSHTFRVQHRCTVENCNMEFFHAQDLEKHMYCRHLSELDADNKFRCWYKSCQKTFTTFHDLTQHENVHKVDLKCTQCDKVFWSTKYRNIHIRRCHQFKGTAGKSLDHETNPSKKSVDGETDPTEKLVDCETDPTEQSVDRETDPTEKSVDRETDPIEKSVDRETDPTELSVDRETDPTEQLVDRETDLPKKSVDGEPNSSENAVDSQTNTITITEVKSLVQDKNAVDNVMYQCIKGYPVDILDLETNPPRMSVDPETNPPENAFEFETNTMTITELKSVVQDKETIDNMKCHCVNGNPTNALNYETNSPRKFVDRENNPPEKAVEFETNTMTITELKSVVQDKETIDHVKHHCVNEHPANLLYCETNPPRKLVDRETNPPEKAVESQTNTILQTIEETMSQDEDISDYVKYYCVEGYPGNDLDHDTNPPEKAFGSQTNTISITEVKTLERQANEDKSDSVMYCNDDWRNSTKPLATYAFHPFRKRPKMGTAWDSKVKLDKKVTSAKQECKSNKSQEWCETLNHDSLKHPEPDMINNPGVRGPVSLEVKLGHEKVPEQYPTNRVQNPKAKKKAFYQICRWKIEISASTSKLCAKVCATPDLVGHIINDHLSAYGTKYTCLWEKCEFYGRHFNPETDIFSHIHSHIFRPQHRCAVENCGMEFSQEQDLEKHKNFHLSEVDDNNKVQCRYED